jgi:hypothetical protein
LLRYTRQLNDGRMSVWLKMVFSFLLNVNFAFGRMKMIIKTLQVLATRPQYMYVYIGCNSFNNLITQ